MKQIDDYVSEKLHIGSNLNIELSFDTFFELLEELGCHILLTEDPNTKEEVRVITLKSKYPKKYPSISIIAKDNYWMAARFKNSNKRLDVHVQDIVFHQYADRNLLLNRYNKNGNVGFKYTRKNAQEIYNLLSKRENNK